MTSSREPWSRAGPFRLPSTWSVRRRASSRAARACPREASWGQGGQLAESWDGDDAPKIPDNIVRGGFARSDLVRSPDHDDAMATICERVAAGRYLPNIHRVFPFGELPLAHRAMERNEAVGKLVVEVDV